MLISHDRQPKDRAVEAEMATTRVSGNALGQRGVMRGAVNLSLPHCVSEAGPAYSRLL